MAMQSLKKYFTEGLIQVAILLSLAGIQVEIDPYLPPFYEIIQGQSSALTQTQFHNLWNSLDRYTLHPKSMDLDGFFTTRRLLHGVHMLDHLQVPATQLETWLVHRELDNSVTTIQNQAGALEAADGLVDMEDSASLTMRIGGGGMPELYNPVEDENLGDIPQFSRGQMDIEEVKEETDELSFWQQERNQNIHQRQLPQEHYQHLFSEDADNEFISDSWRNGNPIHNQMGSILGEDVQFAGQMENTSLSINESLQLLDAGFPLGDQQHLGDADVERVEGGPLQHHRSLLSPLLPEHEPLLDLEQQWQDVLAIMDPQDMVVEDSYLDLSVRGIERETGYMDNLSQYDTCLHQTDLQSCSHITSASRNTSKNDSYHSNQNQTVSISSSSTDFHLSNSDIIDFLLSPAPDNSVDNHNSLSSSMEEQDLPSLFSSLLEEAMFEEINLLDLALEEGLNQPQLSQTEEQDRTDSDSGLSLDFSQSPASPSGSESSCSSSSSSCSSSSMSSTESAPEEGAVGYTHIKMELTDEEEEGAVGGNCPEQNKMCRFNYLQVSHFHNLPWLEHIGHDHTYNQPQCTSQRKSHKQSPDEYVEHHIQELTSSRDEKRARAMKIPFSIDCIVNLPVEEFNKLLAKHRLSEAQLTLIRDIRRRGKNKMAAQNCRQRKLDVLLGLERSVDGLRRHRARLLREKSEVSRSVREMKQRLNDLYQEVYNVLREEQGMLCSANDFVLQQGDDNHMSFSADYSFESRRKSGRRQKEKK